MRLTEKGIGVPNLQGKACRLRIPVGVEIAKGRQVLKDWRLNRESRPYLVEVRAFEFIAADKKCSWLIPRWLLTPILDEYQVSPSHYSSNPTPARR
jgi:hypothetical protein